MITCSLRGQLGNQMFQVAAVIAHALRNNTTYSFPSRSGKRGQFPFAFPFLPIEPNNYSCEQYEEKTFGVYKPIPDNDNFHLKGYWQSEKYFEDYKDEVLSAFDIPKFNRLNKTVSIHIRRSDSLRFMDKLPQPTEKYFHQAIDRFDNLYNFLIFTDDLDFCKKIFKGSRFEFSQEKEAKRAMGQMASCMHNIIVNSTFSWWGAYLNDNLNKIVVCPHADSWFGQKYKHKLSAQDIPCNRWVQIKY